MYIVEIVLRSDVSCQTGKAMCMRISILKNTGRSIGILSKIRYVNLDVLINLYYALLYPSLV